MINLSITRDPEWIKKREELWKPIEADYKEHLRKKEIEPIYHYFMTGQLRPGDILSEGAQFDWFPIQNIEAWNYLYQNVVQNPEVFEKHFYYQFNDLSKRALSSEQELEMWDYFAGNIFSPIVTSKVTIGKEGKLSIFNVDQANMIATLHLYLEGAKADWQSDNPKWMQRINYFLTLFPYIGDENFERKTKFSDFNTRTGRLIKNLLQFIVKPKFETELKNNPAWLEGRLKYLQEFKAMLEKIDMQPAMRQLWEETKKKYETQ